MADLSYPATVLAGLLAFLSPCILPMLPFYLCYLTGLRPQDLRAGRGGRGLILRACGFAAGVTTIFVLMGLGASTVGGIFLEWRDPLRYLAAAILLILGLHLMGALPVPRLSRHGQPFTSGPPASLSGAWLAGLAFGFGWVPCIGPTLTAILFLAALEESAWRGATLLLSYGLAMTLPFVAIAAMAGPALDRIARHRRAFRHVQRASGAMLILFALLIASDTLPAMAGWMLRQADWSGMLL